MCVQFGLIFLCLPFSIKSLKLSEIRPNTDDLSSFLNSTVLKEHANQNKEIIVTFGNLARLDFLLNFAAHLKQIRLQNYVVGAMDRDASHMLRMKRVPTFDIFTDQDHKAHKETGWGTKSFLETGSLRVGIMKSGLKLGYTVLLCDNDVVILRDPWPFFNKFPDADILVQSDSFHESANIEGLESEPNHGNFNVGYLMMKPSAKELATQWFDEVVEGKSWESWDQRVFNKLVPRNALKKRQNSRVITPLFMTYKDTLLLGVLSLSLFCNGHTAFVQRRHEQVHVKESGGPYMIHATYQFGSVHGKRHRLREAKLWLVDPPSYYDQPVLSYSHHVNGPRLGSLGQQISVDVHFEIMNPQLAQIRDALILSMALGRRLVLPKMVCGADRYWNPHSGVIGGSHLMLPYSPCPFDQVFNLDPLIEEKTLADDTLTEKYQSHDMFVREHSFLENSRFQAQGVGNVTKLPQENGEIEQWKKFLSQLREEKSTSGATVLHFELLPNYKIVLDALYPSHGSPDQKRQREAFTTLIQRLPSLWCCAQPSQKGKPGHIHYDLLWDVPNHLDQFGRRFNASWIPIMGP